MNDYFQVISPILLLVLFYYIPRNLALKFFKLGVLPPKAALENNMLLV